MNRALYPLGFLLLVGTLVGATWALQSGSHPAGKGNGEREATPVVACPGYVDVRSGVSQLYPKQYGEVESIAETKIKENDGTERDRAFKKGEVIVQLKGAMAEYTVKKAKAALRAAESELTKAKLLHADKKVKLKMQQAAIDAYKHEKARLTAEFEVKKELAKQADTPLNKLQLKQIEEALAEAGEKIKIEEGKLEQIKLIDPEKQSCTTFLGDPAGWLKPKMFNEPGGVSIAGNRLYIADTNNHRIQVADMKTKDITTLQLQGVEPVRRGAAASAAGSR